MALAYVARFATTATKLERYLKRKVRERGWDGEEAPDLEALVARYVDAGYVDDEAFARARIGSLLRKGYGPRRIGQALGEAGIDADLREELRPAEPERRRAALAFAIKRRFGPFGSHDEGERLDPRAREKQIAAMLRAGHMLDDARALVNAPAIETAQQWADESED